LLFKSKHPSGHFSLRQLEAYLACPYKYKLMYVDKMRWPKVPSGAAFGIAMHKAIEIINRQRFAAGMFTSEDVKHVGNVFDEPWDLELQYSNIEYRNGDDPGRLREQGRTLLKMYVDQFRDLEPSHVEKEFELPIPGRILKPKVIKGRIDLIKNGSVWEFKTSSRTTPQADVDASLQHTLYSWAYQEMFRRVPEVLKTVVLVRTKQPKIAVLETHRDKKDHERLMEIMSQVIRGIRHKVFYKNPQSRFGCNYCTFCDVCKEGLGEEAYHHKRTT